MEQREFKFRAWHLGDKRNDPSMMFDDKVGDIFRWKNEGQPLIIMQFIGEKDNDGVDVYEGDIVSVDTPDDGDVIGYILQCGTLFVLAKSLNDDDNEIHEMWDDGNYEWVSLENATINSVIGNIYANPELLDTL